MKFFSSIVIIGALLLSPAAFAKVNLSVAIDAPSSVTVYDEVRYDVVVSNAGPKRAKGVTVQIDLPETQTSPTVHVMGIVGDMSSQCSQAGTSLVCNLGNIRKNRTRSVWFDIAWPVSATPLTFQAEVSSNSQDANPVDDIATHTVALDYYDTPISGPRDVVNRHCTGQGLIGFYECSLYPSSISSHAITLEANGTITFDNAPFGYTGTWTQVLPDRLQLAYYFNGQLTVAFHGYGVGGDCFEGLTLFPGSSYNAPYEVCLQ